jgi:hypothetical protein
MVCLLVTAVVFSAQAQTPNFTVQASFPSYTINGSPNPTLTVTRGRTYTFQVSSSGHPFFLKTEPVVGNGSTYDIGVTNNGLQNGTLTFQVPTDAPANIFYQCSLHTPMTGSIQTIAAVPVIGPFAAVLLGAMVLVAGLVTLRRRALA